MPYDNLNKFRRNKWRKIFFISVLKFNLMVFHSNHISTLNGVRSVLKL